MSVVDHLRLRGLVGAYMDRELDPPRADLVRSHLRDCWECSGQLELSCLVRAALRRRRRAEPTQLPVRRLRRFSRRVAGR